MIELGEECGLREAIHEIGHSLGLDHEQNRLDRKLHVHIHWDRIIDDEEPQFKRVSPRFFMDIGPYDYESIMHYHPTFFAEPIRYDYDSGYTAATFYETGGAPFMFLLRESDGQSHVYKLNGKGEVESKVKDYAWGSGYTSVAAFEAGGAPYLFSLKKTSKRAYVNAIDKTTGVMLGAVDTPDLDTGYTHVSFVPVGVTTHMVLMKAGTGEATLRKMTNKGAVGAQVGTKNFGTGWTTVVAFRVGTNPFLFLLNEGAGIMEVHSLVGGKFGPRVQRDTSWNPGWSDVAFYVASGKTYLMTLKSSTGEVHIHRMKPGGQVGKEVQRHGWSSGWTLAESFDAGGNSYLFLLKKGSGESHIHQMWWDGSLGLEGQRVPTIEAKKKSKQKLLGAGDWLSHGDVIAAGSLVYGHVNISRLGKRGLYARDCQHWTEGWTHGEAFSTSQGQFLFFLKANGGRAEIRKLATPKPGPTTFGADKEVSTGEIGPMADERWGWPSGWTTVAFFKAGGATHLVRMRAAEGYIVINRMQENGKLGPKTDEISTWQPGWDTVFTFEEAGQAYLFLYRSQHGWASIHELTPQGKVGREVFIDKGWEKGWIMATSYAVKGKTYLFLMKKNGEVRIKHMDKGFVGKRVDRLTKGSAFTQALTLLHRGKTYVLLFSAITGRLELWKVLDDGKLRNRFSLRAQREIGYTRVSVFNQDKTPLLVSMREKD